MKNQKSQVNMKKAMGQCLCWIVRVREPQGRCWASGTPCSWTEDHSGAFCKLFIKLLHFTVAWIDIVGILLNIARFYV